MKRGGWLRRRAPLRKKPRAPALVALDDAARAVVMLRVGAAAFPNPRGGLSWQGRCQWCGEETWLTWAHIRGRRAAPALVHVPLNAMALCWQKCHIGRWHDLRGLAGRTLEREGARMSFLRTIRTAEEIAWLMGPHPRRPDRGGTARALLAEITDRTGGRPAFALPLASLETLRDLAGPDPVA